MNFTTPISRRLLSPAFEHGGLIFNMREKDNLIGLRFGRLVVLSKDNDNSQKRMWLCQCDCGNKKSVRVDHLKSGATTSCGCYNREIASKNNKRHGMSGTPEHSAWYHLIQRCEKPTDSRFHCYGARGIKVCERWKGKNGFANFIKDMGPRPGPEYSIDRINNNDDYKPSNCKWSTRIEQANNKSINIVISYQGETKTLKEWSRVLGFDYKNVWERIKSLGWSFEKAIKMEKKETVRCLVEYNGVTKTITQWCNELHLNYGMVKARIKNGWDINRAFEQPSRRCW